MNAPTMFQAAQRIGRAIRLVHATEGKALRSEDVSFDVSFLFGGQIKGSRMRLFMVYTAGNFIECTTDTPYLQIGEHKYGKPVLDRAMHYDVELYEALKTGLISMDSTMRSNLGVGLPIDVLVVRSGCLRGRPQPPHRGRRALFPRSALALVGGAARRAPEHSATTLQIRNRRKKRKGEETMADATNKIALVTGAGTGVGRAASLALMNAGYTVVLAGRRKEMLDETKKLGDNVGKSLCVSADMTDPGLDRRAVRQDEGDLRPARRAVQQCRHGRAAGAVRGPQPRAMEGGGRTPTSPRRSCARSTPSAS